MFTDSSSWENKKTFFLFNDTLNTFYLQLYGVLHMVKENSEREETCCRHMCYSYRIVARVFLLYAPVVKEGNVLFNDTLNTFYLQLYGVLHMVKENSDSERGNQLPPHVLLFPNSSKGYFIICIIPQTGKHITRRLLHQS